MNKLCICSSSGCFARATHEVTYHSGVTDGGGYFCEKHYNEIVNEQKPDPVCEACNADCNSPGCYELTPPLFPEDVCGALVCDAHYSASIKVVDTIRANRAAREKPKLQSTGLQFYDDGSALCLSNYAERVVNNRAVGTINSWSARAAIDWMFLVRDLYDEQINTGGTPGELAHAQCFSTVANEFSRLARLAVKIESQMRLVYAGFDAETSAELKLRQFNAECDAAYKRMKERSR